MCPCQFAAPRQNRFATEDFENGNEFNGEKFTET